MGFIIGPASWHPTNLGNIPLGTTICGGRLFCKSLGIAYIVAPAATQVGQPWNGNTNTLVGNKPCVIDWSSLNTALINGGLTPTQWFVPSISQLVSALACRSYWDSFSSFYYWSSTEANSQVACWVRFPDGISSTQSKAVSGYYVRAFRCVTY